MNRDLKAKTRLAGWTGYTINLVEQPAAFIIGAYHQPWRIEKAFRMSEHDLQARPIYHHLRESIDTHPTVVFAAIAVKHYIERPKRAGAARNSCAPRGAAAPCRSKPTARSSPPPMGTQCASTICIAG